MSLTRKTYSPMAQTYSYSTTLSPSYSYSRVTTYLDALQRDEQINKLKRDLTNVKSLEMKYYSLLQEISMAEKQNRMLESKNTGLEQQYIEKIQSTRADTSQIEGQLATINSRLTEEESKVESVEKQIQDLLEQLKELKLQEESVQQQNNKLQSQVAACNSHLSKLTEEQQQLSIQKSNVCTDSKQTTTSMQSSMKLLTQLTQMVSKYTEQLNLLHNQSQCFTLECQNMQTLCEKNMTLIQNLQRKVTIQQGQNQQIKNELTNAQQQWQKLQNKFISDKQNLYQNVIKVQEQGLLLKTTLGELDNLLENDSTQKRYLKDVAVKQGMLTGQNEEMRQLLKHLQESYNEKKVQQTAIIEQVNRRMKSDEMVKFAIDQRGIQLSKLRMKYTN